MSLNDGDFDYFSVEVKCKQCGSDNVSLEYIEYEDVKAYCYDCGIKESVTKGVY